MESLYFLSRSFTVMLESSFKPENTKTTITDQPGKTVTVKNTGFVCKCAGTDFPVLNLLPVQTCADCQLLGKSTCHLPHLVPACFSSLMTDVPVSMPLAADISILINRRPQLGMALCSKPKLGFSLLCHFVIVSILSITLPHSFGEVLISSKNLIPHHSGWQEVQDKVLAVLALSQSLFLFVDSSLLAVPSHGTQQELCRTLIRELILLTRAPDSCPFPLPKTPLLISSYEV